MGTGFNPYRGLPPEAYWNTAVSNLDVEAIGGLWTPRFPIRPDDKVATFGSCFAQHIGRALKARGYGWLVAEPPPPGMSAESLVEFNYDLFTCRTGNIYTASLLHQWLGWAASEKPPSEIWQQEDGRCIDPFRPRIEPGGFEDAEELQVSRGQTIAALRSAVRRANVFVFTLGLTESWVHRTGGYEYPLCPGTAAGTFDPDQHLFVNQGFAAVRDHLAAAIQRLRKLNPSLRILLTVSPVPLAATMSGRHVLVATSGSKAILRAVAGDIAEAMDGVDYFPSFEIVTSPVFQGRFFAADRRSVTTAGVAFVMEHFFRSHGAASTPMPATAAPLLDDTSAVADSVCEEQILDAFGPRS